MARQKQTVAVPRPETWTQQQATSSQDVPENRENTVEMKVTPPEANSSRKRESLSDGDGPGEHQQPPMKTRVKTAVECEEMPSRAAATGVLPHSPRVNGDTTAVGEAIWLSSDSEADDPVQGRPENGQRDDGCAPSMDCTICSEHIFVAMEVHEHPILRGVGICSDCFDFLFSGPYTKDKEDGTEEQCRWCGEGGVVVLCDTCDKVFCKECIIRNYGCRRGLEPILGSSNWSCFCCNPEPLRVHVDRLKAFRRSVPPGMHPLVRQKDAQISITRSAPMPSASVQRNHSTSIRGYSNEVKDRRRVRSRITGRRASEGYSGNQGGVETIADLMARAKKGRQNQGNGIQTDFQSSHSRAKHAEGSKAQNASTTGVKRAGRLDREHPTRRARRRHLSEAKPKEVEEKEEKGEKEAEKKEEKEEEAKKAEKEEEKEAAIPPPVPPPVPPARTWIRPHQMNAMRQEAAQRRALAEAERLKGETNLHSNDQQHRHSATQATTGLPGDERQLLQRRRQGEPDADPKLPKGSARSPVQSVDVFGAGGGGRTPEPIRDTNLQASRKFCF